MGSAFQHYVMPALQIGGGIGASALGQPEIGVPLAVSGAAGLAGNAVGGSAGNAISGVGNLAGDAAGAGMGGGTPLTGAQQAAAVGQAPWLQGYLQGATELPAGGPSDASSNGIMGAIQSLAPAAGVGLSKLGQGIGQPTAPPLTPIQRPAAPITPAQMPTRAPVQAVGANTPQIGPQPGPAAAPQQSPLAAYATILRQIGGGMA